MTCSISPRKDSLFLQRLLTREFRNPTPKTGVVFSCLGPCQPSSHSTDRQENIPPNGRGVIRIQLNPNQPPIHYVFINRNENTALGTCLMIGIAVITVLLAFAFTFTNGFQDASSIAATFIASRSATPKSGIIFVAGVSLVGAILGGSAVAFTISGLLTCPHLIRLCWCS